MLATHSEIATGLCAAAENNLWARFVAPPAGRISSKYVTKAPAQNAARITENVSAHVLNPAAAD